jgi:gluconate 2-dehydrogenase alpha chain
MAIRLQRVDVVLVGMGFTGAILARELGQEGLSVVGLERGIRRDTVPDWQSPAMHDELRYSIRNELFQNMAVEPFTFRNHVAEEALPTRNPIGSFLPGTGLGGSAVHWNRESWRFLPSDFVMRSH